MTTMEPGGSAELSEAIEAAMGKLTSDLACGLGVMLTSLGSRHGLWQALGSAGPLAAEDVAAKVTVDRALVREWLRAQAAAGWVDYDAEHDTFSLSSATEAVMVNGPGAGMVEAVIPIIASLGASFEDFSTAFGNGEGFGWHQRTGAHWHGQDALTRLTVPDEAIRSAIAQISDVSAALDRGGSIADVGAGYGTPTIALARLYPAADVLGVDYHDASIMHARQAAAEASVNNVRFELAAAVDLPGDQGPARHGYDLITYFDVLHDLGDPLGALTRARAVLAPNGSVLLFEPLAGDRVADNLHPGGAMFYAVSTLICTPNAVSQRTATSSEPLGTLAGEATLRTLAANAGFSQVRRLDVPLPLNLVLELRP
jgi:SAM-dependent methyltransferase